MAVGVSVVSRSESVVIISYSEFSKEFQNFKQKKKKEVKDFKKINNSQFFHGEYFEVRG